MDMRKIQTFLLVISVCCVIPIDAQNSEDDPHAIVKDLISHHVQAFSHKETPWVVMEGVCVERHGFFTLVPSIWKESEKPSSETPKKVAGKKHIKPLQVVREEKSKRKKLEVGEIPRYDGDFKYGVVLARKLGGQEYRMEILRPGFDGKVARDRDGLIWYTSIVDDITTEVPKGISVLAMLFCDVTDALGLLPALLEKRLSVSVDGPKLFDIDGSKRVNVFEIKQTGSNISFYADAQTKQLVSLSLTYPSEGIYDNVILSDFRWSDGWKEDLLFPRKWSFRDKDGRRLAEFRVETLWFTNTIDNNWFQKTTSRWDLKKIFSALEVKSSERLQRLHTRVLSEISEEQKRKIKDLLEPITKEYRRQCKAIEKKYPQDCPEKQQAIRKLEEEYCNDLDKGLEEIDKILGKK